MNALSEFVNIEKIGHRYVIQYFHLKGLNPTNIKVETDFTLGESASSFIRIKYWMASLNKVVQGAKTNIAVLDQMKRL